MNTKNFLAIAVLFSYLSITPITTLADGYVSIGGGYGGKVNAANVSVELGRISTNQDSHNQLIALDFGFIFNADNVPSGTLDYPVPHGDYRSLGKRQKGNEYALAAKYGLELLKNEGIFAFGLGGFSISEEINLAQSNATGWYYQNSSTSKLNGLYGGGLGYFPVGSKWSISAEYDNRRGITGSVGFRF